MCALLYVLLSQGKGPVRVLLFSPLSHSLLPMSHTTVTRDHGVRWLQACWNDILITPGISPCGTLPITERLFLQAA